MNRSKRQDDEMSLEERLDALLQSWNMPAIRQYEFCPDRKWRLDFAWPEIRLGIEVQGGTFMRGPSGHTSGVGVRDGHDKLNVAAILGWVILQVDTTLLPKRPNAEKQAFLLELITLASNRQFVLSLPNRVFDQCYPLESTPKRPESTRNMGPDRSS